MQTCELCGIIARLCVRRTGGYYFLRSRETIPLTARLIGRTDMVSQHCESTLFNSHSGCQAAVRLEAAQACRAHQRLGAIETIQNLPAHHVHLAHYYTDVADFTRICGSDTGMR